MKKIIISLFIILSLSTMPVSAAESTDITVTQGTETVAISQQYYETLAYYLNAHEWWNAITLLQAINLPAGESSNGNDMIYITTISGTLGLGRSGSRQYAHIVGDRYDYCVASYTVTPDPLTSSSYLAGDYNHDGKVNDTDTFLVEHYGEKRTYDGEVGFYSELVP